MACDGHQYPSFAVREVASCDRGLRRVGESPSDELRAEIVGVALGQCLVPFAQDFQIEFVDEVKFSLDAFVHRLAVFACHFPFG